MSAAIGRGPKMADVELRGIQKRYGGVLAVASVDLRVAPGEFVSMLGPSGCGKTTTLRIIAGLTRPDQGQVIIGGRVMNDVPVHHRGLGLVAQNYALFPHMTVMENITFGLRMRHAAPVDIRRKAHEALEMVRLSGLEDRYPRQLSGGQQQRVALARCFLVEPAVLLLDEPLGALDKKLREAMQVELKSLQRQVGITTIFVTHDQEEALTLSDRIAVMHEGRIHQVGTPHEIYETPRTRFVAEFIGVCNFLEGKVVGREAGAVILRTDGGALVRVVTEGRSTLAEGAKAVAAVRPEKLTVRAPGSAAGQALSARLEAVVYVGTAVHYHLRTVTGERLVVYRQNDVAAPLGLAPGAEVVVSWEAEAARLLPEESG
jgi:spermidine/putrescine ABC transporter ATP-binding subunit